MQSETAQKQNSHGSCRSLSSSVGKGKVRLLAHTSPYLCEDAGERARSRAFMQMEGPPGRPLVGVSYLGTPPAQRPLTPSQLGARGWRNSSGVASLGAIRASAYLYVRKPVPRSVMCRGTISFASGAIEIEATVIAEALDLPPEVLMTMVRSGQITSLCERGVDADEGPTG